MVKLAILDFKYLSLMTHYIIFNIFQSPLFLLNLQNSYGADPSVLAITILNMAHIHCIVIIVLASGVMFHKWWHDFE